MKKIMSARHVTWIVPVLFFLLLSGWAVSSPVGSSPDDDYHQSSIWCSDGPRQGRCIDIIYPKAKAVPALVGAGQECYAFKPRISAACQYAIPSNEFVIVKRVNDAKHLYPTSYYRVMGLFVSDNISYSVLGMRLFNVFLASLMLWLVLLLAPKGIRTSYLLVTSAVFVPLGLFIIPSVNPSSWTITGLAAYWAFALSLLHEERLSSKRGFVLALFAMVSAGMAIASRPDAMIYVGITTVVVLVYAGWKQMKKNWPSVLLLIGVSLFAAYSYLTVTAPGSGKVMGKSARGLGLLLMNTLNLPELYEGVVGGWNLGWNDTVMPFLIPFVGMLAVMFILYRGMLVWELRKVAATGLAFVAMVSVPLAFYQLEGLRVGQVVQSRYVIPLLVLFLVTVSLGRTVYDEVNFPVPVAVLMFGALTVSASIAFLVNAHRYISGEDSTLARLNWPVEWWSNIGIPWPLVLAATIFSTFGYMLLVMSTVARGNTSNGTSSQMVDVLADSDLPIRT